MTIYEHKTSLTVSGGSNNTVSLNIRGGLLRQVIVLANTSTTTFRANLVDEDALVRTNWDFHTGELNELGFAMPITGRTRLNILNASVSDTFKVYLGVEE